MIEDDDLDHLLQSAFPTAPPRLAENVMRRIGQLPRENGAQIPDLFTRRKLPLVHSSLMALAMMAVFALGLCAHEWLYPAADAPRLSTDSGLYVIELKEL